MQFVDLFSFTSSVEIKRELRYCAGFKCKSIYFLPQVEIRWQHEMSNQKFVFRALVYGESTTAGQYALCQAAVSMESWTNREHSPETILHGSTQTTRML